MVLMDIKTVPRDGTRVIMFAKSGSKGSRGSDGKWGVSRFVGDVLKNWNHPNSPPELWCHLPIVAANNNEEK